MRNGLVRTAGRGARKKAEALEPTSAVEPFGRRAQTPPLCRGYSYSTARRGIAEPLSATEFFPTVTITFTDTLLPLE